MRNRKARTSCSAPKAGMTLPARARREAVVPTSVIATPLATSQRSAVARMTWSGIATRVRTSPPKLSPSSPSAPIFRALLADSCLTAQATKRSARAKSRQMMPMSTSVIVSASSGHRRPQQARNTRPRPRIQSVWGIARQASCRVRERKRMDRSYLEAETSRPLRHHPDDLAGHGLRDWWLVAGGCGGRELPFTSHHARQRRHPRERSLFVDWIENRRRTNHEKAASVRDGGGDPRVRCRRVRHEHAVRAKRDALWSPENPRRAGACG